MATSRSRRGFLKGLLAAPALGLGRRATGSVDYDLGEFPVAGFEFHDGPGLGDRLRPGLEVQLVAEPGNRHDARAIRVEALGRHIGYVPRSENASLARLLAQGAELTARVRELRPGTGRRETVMIRVRLRQEAGTGQALE